MSSVTRWLDYSSTFGHLYQWKLAQWHTKFAKVGPRFSQIVNKPSKNCPRLWRFCQNGEISPNLVTLATKMNKCVALQKDVQKTTLKRSKLSAWSSPSSSSTTASAHWRSKRRTERNNFQRLLYRCVSTCDAWILLAFSMCDSCLNFLNWCWNQCD